MDPRAFWYKPVIFLLACGSIVAIIGVVGFALLKWSTNVRNLIGIRKDWLDMEKTKEDLRNARASIRIATDEEILKYDPSRRKIGGYKFTLHINARLFPLLLFYVLVALLTAIVAPQMWAHLVERVINTIAQLLHISN